MKIGINTLYENPHAPTGAHVYNINIVHELSKVDNKNEYFIFVSKANQGFLSIKNSNFHTIICKNSNENRFFRLRFSISSHI